MYGDFPAKITVCTPHIRINIYGSGQPYIYGIYGYTVYIRSYTAYIRYTEIPCTVWANPSIPESHVWSWENGPSCIPSPPHAVPCPLPTTCSALSPLSTTCSALSPPPPHAVPCPLPPPHARRGIQNEQDVHAPCLSFLVFGTCRS